MKKLAILIVVTLLLASSVLASGLSVQLKRTNPGVAGTKSAELIFDVVNTDMTHKVEGFLWCMSPDDAIVSSSLGVGTGSGAQYVSPIFTMDTGPYQKAMSLTIEADTPGDKRTGCTIKYIPYKETSTTGAQEIPISFDGTIDKNGKTVEGFVVTLVNYTAEVASTDDSEGKKASVRLKVDTSFKDIEVGSTETVEGLTINVLKANANSIDVKITGKKTGETTASSTKQYLKMNGQYITTVSDEDYRELRLDKNVPFVKDMSNPQCPEGKTECKSNEVIEVGGVDIPIWTIILGIAVVVLLVFYLLGKTSRRD